MMAQIIRMVKIIAVFLLAGLSLFVYKLALQPAIHQFYKLEPDFLMVYTLVLVAALVHAVLLSSVVLKFYRLSMHWVSAVMGLAVLAYCVQLVWLSPLQHFPFWLTVFLSYVLVWAGVLWFGYWCVQREKAFEMQAHLSSATDNSLAGMDTTGSYGLHAKNRQG